ncbi:hypothetical protein [Nostoc sp.]
MTSIVIQWYIISIENKKTGEKTMSYTYDPYNWEDYTEQEQKQILKDLFNGTCKPEKRFQETTFNSDLREIFETEPVTALYRTSRFKKPTHSTKKVTRFVLS